MSKNIDWRDLYPELIDDPFLRIRDESSSFVILTSKGKVGVLSKLSKRIIVPFEFDKITSNGYGFEVCNYYKMGTGKECGWFSKDGSFSIPCVYDSIQYLGNYIQVRQYSRLGLYSFDGKLIVPTENKNIFFTKKYIVTEKICDEISVYDLKGNTLLSTKHSTN